MAYNTGFPIGYQPIPQYYAPNYQTQQPNVQPQNNGIIWVQGEAGAKSYLIAPNTTVQLWDSEANVIYLKSSDASGMPSIKTLDYTIREMQTPVNRSQTEQVDMSRFVTWDQLEEKLKGFRESMPAGKENKNE